MVVLEFCISVRTWRVAPASDWAVDLCTGLCKGYVLEDDDTILVVMG